MTELAMPAISSPAHTPKTSIPVSVYTANIVCGTSSGIIITTSTVCAAPFSLFLLRPPKNTFSIASQPPTPARPPTTMPFSECAAPPPPTTYSASPASSQNANITSGTTSSLLRISAGSSTANTSTIRTKAGSSTPARARAAANGTKTSTTGPASDTALPLSRPLLAPHPGSRARARRARRNLTPSPTPSAHDDNSHAPSGLRPHSTCSCAALSQSLQQTPTHVSSTIPP